MRRELSDKDRALILEYAKNYLDYTSSTSTNRLSSTRCFPISDP